MKRTIEPEWLDELLPNDPRAQRSRRDLRRVNSWMGNLKTMERNLKSSLSKHPPRRIVELGAGDGTFMLRLARLFPQWKQVEVTLVDQQNIVTEKTLATFQELAWKVNVVRADIFDWLPNASESNCVLANLFLHHFDDEKLSTLFGMIASKTNYFFACEPRRSNLALAASRMLFFIGCNSVTRHDAVISVRAGFSNSELSALWPKNKNWDLLEVRAGLFSHSFVACRL